MDRPYIGIGILITRGNTILIGERLSKSGGAGTFQIPGGHLEFEQSFADCARQEVQEETGLKDIRIKGIICVNNDIIFYPAKNKHYVTIGILAESEKGEPYDAEPEKSRNWKWVDPKNLPSPMFTSSKRVIDCWLQKKISNEAL